MAGSSLCVSNIWRCSRPQKNPRHAPRMVIALGDSFHDRDAHDRLSVADRDAIAALQASRDWIWISGNHDPALPAHLGGLVATEVAIGPIAFRHEPTGAAGEIA